VAQVEISEFAESDLADVYNAILVTNGEALATRILERIGSTIDRLRDFPESGRKDARLSGDSLRVLSFERWTVVYRFDGATALILRVVDAARELSQVRLEED
jgi:plasmid stabilization system protein ParE